MYTITSFDSNRININIGTVNITTRNTLAAWKHVLGLCGSVFERSRVSTSRDSVLGIRGNARGW